MLGSVRYTSSIRNVKSPLLPFIQHSGEYNEFSSESPSSCLGWAPQQAQRWSSKERRTVKQCAGTAWAHNALEVCRRYSDEGEKGASKSAESKRGENAQQGEDMWTGFWRRNRSLYVGHTFQRKQSDPCNGIQAYVCECTPTHSHTVPCSNIFYSQPFGGRASDTAWWQHVCKKAWKKWSAGGFLMALHVLLIHSTNRFLYLLGARQCLRFWWFISYKLIFHQNAFCCAFTFEWEEKINRQIKHMGC